MRSLVTCSSFQPSDLWELNVVSPTQYFCYNSLAYDNKGFNRCVPTVPGSITHSPFLFVVLPYALFSWCNFSEIKIEQPQII
jgi:hypothetical protein